EIKKNTLDDNVSERVDILRRRLRRANEKENLQASLAIPPSPSQTSSPVTFSQTIMSPHQRQNTGLKVNSQVINRPELTSGAQEGFDERKKKSSKTPAQQTLPKDKSGISQYWRRATLNAAFISNVAVNNNNAAVNNNNNNNNNAAVNGNVIVGSKRSVCGD